MFCIVHLPEHFVVELHVSAMLSLLDLKVNIPFPTALRIIKGLPRHFLKIFKIMKKFLIVL